MTEETLEAKCQRLESENESLTAQNQELAATIFKLQTDAKASKAMQMLEEVKIARAQMKAANKKPQGKK